MSKISTMVIILLITLSLVACGSATPVPPAEGQETGAEKSAAASDGPVIKVVEPVARASIPNGAVYMQLVNEGDADERLVSVESDVAEAVELHETRIENDIMKMGPIEAVAVPAGGSAVLEPGGIHVMLIGLKEELATGDTFELTLNFEQTGPQIIEVAVAEGMATGNRDANHEHEEGEMGNEQAEGEMAHGDEAGETAEHGHAASSAVAMQPQVFQVVAVAYLMDTAGFHGLDERLNEGGQIEAGDAGVVNRVNRVLAVTDWPEELQPQAEALQAVLAEYGEALSNDDVEAARPLATQAHEAQHDLSHAIEGWPGEIEGESGYEQTFQVVAAAYLMDTAGFHGLDERLNEGGQIEAGDAGAVNRVNRVLAVTDWPEELQPQAEALQAVLAEYGEALANDDVEAARPLATQAHEAQHDLSHAIEGWLGGDGGHGEHEMAAGEAAHRFQVTAAAYLMDMAGFHGLDERLNEGGQIEAGDAGVVNRVNRVLAVTDWPEELQPQAEALQAVLAEYGEALSNDDVEAARPLATQAHEAQHDLSHAIEGWLGGDGGHGEAHPHGEGEPHGQEEGHED